MSTPAWALVIASALLAGIAAAPVDARTLAEVFGSRRFAALELRPLAAVLADTVASTYPVASASSSVTYAFDPELRTFARQPSVAGPIFGERADTIGRRRLTVALSYSYVDLDAIDGEDLDHLTNRPTLAGEVISFPVRDGVCTLRDGRLTSFLPVQVDLDLGVTASILTPSFTYGVTPHLDVNVSVPLLRTALDLSARTAVPDPRLPQFAVPSPAAPGGCPASRGRISESESAVGVGDVLVRAKYALNRGWPFDVAAALGLSVPTGNEENLAGTGDTQVQPMFVASRIVFDRFEPLVNVGLDIDASDLGRTVVRWAVGTTAEIRRPLTAAVAVLGRNELGRQTNAIARPFFFQIERNDVYDGSMGVRYRLGESGLISANVLVPLNDDGLRAAVIPTVAVEYGF